jgi:hypothetical protein
MSFEPALTLGIIFSDTAIREQGTGKNSLIGCFSIFNLPQIPCAVAPFFITAFITNLTGDLKEIDVTARIENPKNGMVLASTTGKIQFLQPQERNDVSEISIPIFNLGFPSAELYKVVILINNEKVGERPLLVRDSRATQTTL